MPAEFFRKEAVFRQKRMRELTAFAFKAYVAEAYRGFRIRGKLTVFQKACIRLEIKFFAEDNKAHRAGCDPVVFRGGEAHNPAFA